MAKIRVHELARELDKTSKDMVAILQGMGLNIKNHMSTLEDSQAEWIRNRLTDQPVPEKKTERTVETAATTGKPDRAVKDAATTRKPERAVKDTVPTRKPESQKTRPEPPRVQARKPGSTSQPAAKTGKEGPQQRQKAPTAPVPRDSKSKGSPSPVQSRDTGASPGVKKAEPPRKGPVPLKKPGQDKPGPAQTRGKVADKKFQPQQKSFARPQRKGKHKKKKEIVIQQTPAKIIVGDRIMVRDLAEKMNKTPAELVKKLMELGTLATINQVIDYEVIEILASLFDVGVEREISEEEKMLADIIDSEESLITRPPIVTVMGHVDHGKTSLLDQIRKADVASGEAGGITQHIGAYQVTVNNEKITFIDTPGHEAFTAMRARGANLTDIVILVVAADDGVMPQTVEAINHIKAANVPFLVAINKIDKPGANPERVMQQLTEFKIVPEEWGGDTIFVPVSAKTGYGIEHLLEMILLLAEIREIRANPNRLAEGVVLEAELDKGRGAVATILVQKGTLHAGDFLISGVNWCKVRAMMDDKGRRVDEAGPATPVEIMGWSDVPETGEVVKACPEKIAKEISSLRMHEKKLEEQRQNSKVSLDDFFKQMQNAEIKDLNLIIKGDVQGSIEALSQSLEKLSTDEVKINIIHSGVGAISETDVMLASASNAIIIGFNVRPETKARKHAEDEKIDVRLYRVIYEAIDDVKNAMVGLLAPEYAEKYLGRAEVRATFKVPNVGVVAGSYVNDGKITRNANIRILRDGVIIYEGKLASLKRFKDDVREVSENYECGIGIKDFNDIKEGDIFEAYIMVEVPREL